MAKPPTLCLMVKAPNVGKAKTRLAPTFTECGAAKLAKALLLDAIDSWKELAAHFLIATTGDFDAELAQHLARLRCMPQGEGSLGTRMERALRAGLVRSEIAMVVGTDIPGLGMGDYQEATALLDTYDAVLGPSEDGGFYLLALRACPEGLLDGVPWSSANTCEQTLARLQEAGMRVALLQPRFDVDDSSDVPKLAAHLRQHPSSMVHTRAFLGSPDDPSISVIVPVLNEERRLRGALRRLVAEPGWAEILVVDGGSGDRSVEVASSFAGVRVLRTSAGRAQQMNVGAFEAVGGTLLFLHADVQLPAGSAREIMAVTQGGEHVAGAFRLQTQYDEQGRARRWVRPLLRLADMRSHYSKLPYGDQAIFVRRSAFREVGGYPAQELFEDLSLSTALDRNQPMKILKGPVVVSGRRFQERPLYYLALMNSFPLLYRLGISPGRLARFYRNTR